MTMRSSSIIFFLSVLPSVLLAQQARPPAIEWMREYEGEANAYASQVIVTSDGGFVVTGITSPPVQGPWAWNSLYLAKTELGIRLTQPDSICSVGSDERGLSPRASGSGTSFRH